MVQDRTDVQNYVEMVVDQMGLRLSRPSDGRCYSSKYASKCSVFNIATSEHLPPTVTSFSESRLGEWHRLKKLEAVTQIFRVGEDNLKISGLSSRLNIKSTAPPPRSITQL
jgi:hypothetical protein